ncbi:MAG: phosphopyruvate hydratase [Candidatus Pacebacteria bacterium]|nr:phosphopyruvate hydratase [Candidatus Paceibacterota bacterium]
MSSIKSIRAREIIDSRGAPTVEVECATEDGVFVDSVPAGASKGEREAVELRDGGIKYGGFGVSKAIDNINKIISARLNGLNPEDQKEIDNLMIALDGTANKSNLGANSILGVSMAVCRAGAKARGLELYEHISSLQSGRHKRKYRMPKACFNVINGGKHAGNNLDFQEFMIVPLAGSFKEELRMAVETYHTIKGKLKKNYSETAINVGDEGGFAPPIDVAEVALGIIVKAIESAGFKGGIKIVLDIAASHFFKDGYYALSTGGFTKDEFIDYYADLVSKYPIIGLEDPLEEKDWQGFKEITDNLGPEVMIIGDDLLVSNAKYIKEAKEGEACNAVLLKPNQVGTVSELLESINLAKEYGWKTVVSHRSGETNDDFIADLAVGIGADFIKSGAPARGERTAKYNRLIKIEEMLKYILD